MPLRDNVDAYLKRNESTGCLEWTRFIDKAGYGRVRYDGESGYVHRFVWEREHGPIPEDLLLRHKCDNPKCADLEHLETGTPADNAKDRDSRGRNGLITHGRYVGGITRKYGTRQDASKALRRFNEEQVREIRTLYAAGGFTHKQLADRFGTSRAMVGEIVNLKAYVDIV